MHRLVTLPATPAQPERYMIEELHGDTWWFAEDVGGQPLIYPYKKHATFMANALDGGVFPKDLSQVAWTDEGGSR